MVQREARELRPNERWEEESSSAPKEPRLWKAAPASDEVSTRLHVEKPQTPTAQQNDAIILEAVFDIDVSQQLSNDEALLKLRQTANPHRECLQQSATGCKTAG